MPGVRRRNPIVSKRRIDDEAEDDGGPGTFLEDEDSMSDGSLSDDEVVDGSDLGHIDNTSPQLLEVSENQSGTAPVTFTGNGGPKAARTQSNKSQTPVVNGTNDTDLMLNGLKISDQNGTDEETHYDDMHSNGLVAEIVTSTPEVGLAQMDQPQESAIDRRRREHDEYKKKRDADPAFVPNRGAFFMHDHRHAGPAANGFRPFGRGRGRGGGRGGIGGPFVPMHYMPQAEVTDSPWTHDMHETIQEPINRGPRQQPIPYAGTVPQAPRGPPVNRSLSTTKVLGNVQVRVLLPYMKEPIKCPPITVKQYTRLPDHRPPLRRDKPVRISLPENAPRYIFPAQDRSFIFIPRAMRPNQQGFGGRTKGRSGLGSIGGYSRRTSVFGGSIYGGTSYPPSVAMSRRSSLAMEVQRDGIISPTGSAISRPPIPMDNTRPIVRLPPPVQGNTAQPSINGDQNIPFLDPVTSNETQQTLGYPPPQKPTFRENRNNAIPMHQPRPQKSVSVADIESPATMAFNPPQQQQQPFHQQVPVQMNGNSYESHLISHTRNPSYPSQTSTGTPLSQIPERAIHAQPFQPNPYQQQGYYPQQYPMMPPQQQGYYYSQQQYNQDMNGQTPAFHPGQQHNGLLQQPAQQQASQGADVPANLVAQEVNGMVYYYNAADIPAVATFPNYQQPQTYSMQPFGGVVGMGGMMTPSPDGFYVPQPPQGVVYYSQQ